MTHAFYENRIVEIWGGQFIIQAQNVGRNWSEGKMEVCALGYSQCGPIATYLSDFRWGRLNFDTDAAVERTDGPRRLFSSGEGGRGKS